jgi:hypothetical protein
MPINADLRQAVVLSLESQGADVGLAVKEVLADIGREQAILTKEWEEGSLSVEQFIAMMKSLTAEFRKYQEISREVGRRSEEGIAKRGRIDALVREEQALETLNAALDKNRQAQEREAQATAWMTRQATDLAAAMEGLAQHEQSAATAGKSFNSQIDAMAGPMARAQGGIAGMAQSIDAMPAKARDGFGSIINSMADYTSGLGGMSEQQIRAGAKINALGKQFDGVGKSTRNAGYGLLSFSYAMQDFTQSGLAAVMNNIPMMVMGLGGSAGLAGATMIAAAAFQTAAPHLEGFGKKLGALRDPLRDAGSDLAGLEERFKALSDKPFKVAADYTALSMMRAEIKETKAAIAEWEAMKDARSESQTSSKAIIDEGITEGGGAKAVEAAILDVKKKQGTLYAGSTLHGDYAVAKSRRDNAKGLAASARKTLGSTAGDAADLVTEHFQGEMSRVQEAMEAEAKEKIAKTVANASRNEGARSELEGYYLNNKETFAAHGVTNKFGAGIVLGSAENVKAAKENRKAVKEQEEAAKAKIQKEKEVADAVAEAGGIGADASKDNEAARLKAERENVAAGKRGQSAQTAAANKIDDGINPYLQHAFARNKLAQENRDPSAVSGNQMGAMLTQETAKFLRANRQDPGLADEMVRKAFQDMIEKFVESQSVTGNAAQSLVAVMQQAEAVASRQGQGLSESLMKASMMGQQWGRAGTSRRSFMPTGGP